MLDLHVMRFVLLVGALVHCASAAFTNPKCQRMWDAKLAQYIALRDAHRQVVCVNGKGLVYPEKFTKGAVSSCVVPVCPFSCAMPAALGVAQA